jgi:putative hydrolase of the HAD superfamily
MIFFDIDGTLIDHLSASAAASLSFYDHFSGRIPFAREGFAEIWEAIVDKHFNRYCRAEISIWEQRRARMREVFGDERLSDAECDSRYSFYIREYESMTSAYDDAADCLRDLNGMPLGIISNGARDQQTGKLERAGLLQHFSVLVFSEDVAIGKPAALIFEEACRLAGENPSQCVHVGDDLTADIAGGLNAGLRVVWLDRMRKFTHVEAAARIEHLAELGSVLKPELAHVEKR